MNLVECRKIIVAVRNHELSPRAAAARADISEEFFVNVDREFDNGDMLGGSVSDFERVTDEFAEELFKLQRT